MRFTTLADKLLGLLSVAANKIPYFSGTSSAGTLDFVDEDNMVSDSATAVPSQQSVKAYVDAGTGGVALLSTVTIAGTPATVDFTSIITDTYNKYTLEFDGLFGSTPGDLNIRVSDNNGVGWISTATYRIAGTKQTTAGTEADNVATTATAITTGMNMAGGLSGTLEIWGTATGANRALYRLFGSSGGALAYGQGAAMFYDSSAPDVINAVQILPSAGTFTGGVIKVYGHK